MMCRLSSLKIGDVVDSLFFFSTGIGLLPFPGVVQSQWSPVHEVTLSIYLGFGQQRALEPQILDTFTATFYVQQNTGSMICDTAIPEMAMGWVHPWVGLGWVGLGWVSNGLGWVGLRNLDPWPSLCDTILKGGNGTIQHGII